MALLILIKSLQWNVYAFTADRRLHGPTMWPARALLWASVPSVTSITRVVISVQRLAGARQLSV